MLLEVITLRNRNTILAIVLLLIALTVPLYVTSYHTGLLIYVLVYMTLVGAWNILSGYTGYLLLGAAAFYGLGAYTVPLFSAILPYYAAIPVAGLICFGAAILIGIPFLRIKGPYFIIATYALAELISNVILYLEIHYTSTVGRYIDPQPTTNIYFVMVAITFITLLTAYRIKNSRFGIGLLSIKADEDAAEATGVNTFLYKELAFGLSAFFMGLAGAASIARLGYIDNTIAFKATFSFYTLIMALIGGAGNILGGAVSAITLSLLFEFFFSAAEPYLFSICLGIAIFIIMLYAPKGFLEILPLLRRKFPRKSRPLAS